MGHVFGHVDFSARFLDPIDQPDANEKVEAAGEISVCERNLPDKCEVSVHCMSSGTNSLISDLCFRLFTWQSFALDMVPRDKL